MKRIRMFLSILLIFVCMFGTGCFEYGLDRSKGVSIDEYDPTLSEFSVANYHLPADFLDTSGYTNGKFYWDVEVHWGFLEKLDKSLMWLSFEQAEYEDAKNRILVDIVPLNHQEKERMLSYLLEA